MLITAVLLIGKRHINQKWRFSTARMPQGSKEWLDRVKEDKRACQTGIWNSPGQYKEFLDMDGPKD